MNLDSITHRLDTETVGVAGVGLVAVLAGVTKFTHPGLWLGYEPELVRDVITALGVEPLTVFGIGETLLGLAILTLRRWEVTGLAALWLAVITVQVGRLERWDLVIRDLGLMFYAATVALYQHRQQHS